jgi:hypothetical protein
MRITGTTGDGSIITKTDQAMKNKRIVLLLLAGMPLWLTAQDKILEKSGKRPAWLYGLESNFIITSGTGTTIQEAQQKALEVVREQIVGSVAVQVMTKTESSQEEVTTNRKVTSFLEKFSSQTTSESGKVPFLQGISLSKASDFHWEKRQRKDKSTYFEYNIRYPFPSAELSQLVFEYKLRDERMSKSLVNLLDQIGQIASVEQIERNMEELTVLASYFTDGRKSQADMGIAAYRNLYSAMTLVESGSSLGELRYNLRLGDRNITTVKKPVLKSGCAKIGNTSLEGDLFVVRYDYADCYEDPNNNIQVKYRFGSVDLQKAFFFDVAENKTELYVSEPIRLTMGSGVPKMDLVLVSKYASECKIEKITLEIQGSAPIVVENINQILAGKGNHPLQAIVNLPVQNEAISTKGKSLPVLTGYIQYRSLKTGELHTYRIYNLPYSTDW